MSVESSLIQCACCLSGRCRGRDLRFVRRESALYCKGAGGARMKARRGRRLIRMAVGTSAKQGQRNSKIQLGQDAASGGSRAQEIG